MVACAGSAQEAGKGGHAAPQAAEHAKPAAEHGASHEEAPMPNEIWWKWANFAVLAACLGFLIAKNAGSFFGTRTEEIQKGIREAAAVRADAEARATAIEKRIANLNAEVEAMRQNSQAEIAREGERVRAETAAQIEKIQKQAEAEIASAAKSASQELKAYSAELAIRLAEQQIQQQMTSQNQEQLADAFVDDIRRKAALN
jgi:F-type H+-transporting ATPase subunit b